MSLNLDPRQRAMLREMGIRVWQPEATALTTPDAIESVALNADAGIAAGRLAVTAQPAAPPAQTSRRPAARPTHTAAASAQAPPAAPPVEGAAASWLLGPPQALYADSGQAGGARWLVLAETPASALHAAAFDGDAGKLLGNMLRAARLDRAGAALLAPLARQAAGATTTAAAAAAQELTAALPGLIAHARPDVILVMGRLAALALLPAGEPFGKLRGKAHTLYGANTVVTYDAAHLLRKCEDKAGAWSDLCLAMSLAAPAG